MNTASNDFKCAVLKFIDELIVQYPQNKTPILSRIHVCTRIDSDSLFSEFNGKLTPQLKDQILKKDDSILKNNALFSHVYKDNFWGDYVLDQDDKNVIWQWYAHFISISDKYKKEEL